MLNLIAFAIITLFAIAVGFAFIVFCLAVIRAAFDILQDLFY